MSEHTFAQPRIVAGHARAECRVAIWMQCPRCQQEHSHILTAQDHLHLGGLRYWRVECHGAWYVLRVSSAQIAAALEQAVDISTTRELNLRWLAVGTYDTSDTHERCNADAEGANCVE